MRPIPWPRLAGAILPVCVAFAFAASPSYAQDWSALTSQPPVEGFVPETAPDLALATPADALRVLIAGDSWAQYMWDDDSHDDVLDRFGLADAQALSRSLGDDPGPGYTGPEYAISGSEARQWVDTANFPWLANTVAVLQANPTIDWVVLSIGGNDILAGKSDGGWYKDMDLDVPGSEQALFDQLEANTFTVINTLLAVRPDIQILLSSYDYPNFNVGFWCFLYACAKRDDLSRDPNNDLITDAELNGMMVELESRRIDWCATEPRLFYDNSVGLMHHLYGDGVSGPRVLPKPGDTDPDYLPFPGGNPLRPTLRSAFRVPGGIDADPIHLDFEGYQIKIGHQVEAHFLPALRGAPDLSVVSEGSGFDGWSDGVGFGSDAVRVGDQAGRSVTGVVSFDTSALPVGSTVTRATVWLTRNTGVGVNPFVNGALGTPIVDVVGGGFGASASLEAGDATAAADATDCALVHGSARASGYTLRLELDPSGLEAIEAGGRTQLRLSFPVVNSFDDYVGFLTGAAGAWSPQTVSTFAEVMGTGQPRLDLQYEAPTAVAQNPIDAGLRLLPPTPNPFNPSTQITLELDAPASAAGLVIYDLAGRRIRTLHRGGLPSGRRVFTWMGRDDGGRIVASGTYLVRLTTERSSVGQRLVLLK